MIMFFALQSWDDADARTRALAEQPGKFIQWDLP